MADSVEVSTIETTDGTIGVIRDNAARQSIANIREGKETVGSVAWENVKGRPTKVSELENDKKYQTDENVSNTLNSTLYAGSSTHGGPATSADKLTTARTISLGGAATGSGSFDGSANSTINVSSLDATKLTGVVPITNLPPSVVERMSVVKDDTERFALTKDKVQDGDVVKVQSSGLMYYVVDDDKLNAEAGYEVFKAGTAASVPWGGVTGKPSSYPPSSHTHNFIGQIDTRDTNQTPSWYYSNYAKFIVNEFKLNSRIGLPISTTFSDLITIVPWNDNSGGNVVQLAVDYSTNTLYIRSGTGNTWGSWKSTGGSKSAKYTLAASNWSGSSAPYTYDLGSAYGNNSVIGFDSAVGNTTQLEAARAADIQGSSTTKIYAYGDKPTVDIPIVIIYQ